MSNHHEGSPSRDRSRRHPANGPPLAHHPHGKFEVPSVAQQQQALIDTRHDVSPRLRLTAAPAVTRLKQLPRAGPPFHSVPESSNLLILVTYDGVEFHTRKSFLCMASPYLGGHTRNASARKDIYLVSDSGLAYTEGKKFFIGSLRKLRGGVPRILVNEDAKTVHALLCHVYGIAPKVDMRTAEDPAKTSPFLHFVSVYELALLLGFQFIAKALKSTMNELISEINFESASPAVAIRTYIVASQLDLTGEMFRAAIATLFDPLSCAEINYMCLDKASRCRLVNYRLECAEAVKKVFNRGLPREHASLVECKQCASRSNGSTRIAEYWRQFYSTVHEYIDAAPMMVFCSLELPLSCSDTAMACRSCSMAGPENFKKALGILRAEANEAIADIRLDMRPPGSWPREIVEEIDRRYGFCVVRNGAPDFGDDIWYKLEDR